jgi:hypothetical protein
VGSSTGTWSALLVFGSLAVALGGCGSLSLSLRAESVALAANAQRNAVVGPASEQSLGETAAQGIDEFAEPAPVASASPSSISVDAMTSDDAPSWPVALAGPVDAAVRGTPEPTPPTTTSKNSIRGRSSTRRCSASTTTSTSTSSSRLRRATMRSPRTSASR